MCARKLFIKPNLLSPSQYGFRNGMSTTDALASFSKMVYKTLDEGKAAAAIFVDLAKAFDTLDHKLLLEKLEDLGIRGKAHEIFASYLLNRVQIVKIGNSVSQTVQISHGVPQGTILGPILFILFINDMFSINTVGTPLSYADDTVVFYTATDWESLEEIMGRDFIKYIKWFNENSLTINIDKTEILRFGCYKDSIKSNNSLSLDMGTERKIIKSTNSTKYLGIIIDQQLRWEEHVFSVTNKLRSLPFTFKKLNNILSREQVLKVYYALFQSIATYGIIAWGGAYDNVMRTISTLQKSVLKIIFKKERLYPTNMLFEEIQMLPIAKIYQSTAVMQLVKNKELRFYEGTTRNAQNFRVKQVNRKKEVGRKAYDFIGINCFNTLPANTRKVWSQKDFKKKLNEELLSSNNRSEEY